MLVFAYASQCMSVHYMYVCIKERTCEDWFCMSVHYMCVCVKERTCEDWFCCCDFGLCH